MVLEITLGLVQYMDQRLHQQFAIDMDCELCSYHSYHMMCRTAQTKCYNLCQLFKHHAINIIRSRWYHVKEETETQSYGVPKLWRTKVVTFISMYGFFYY